MLRAITGWVRPPLRAVARVEDFTLQLYGRTRSPEVLGSWISLSWLGAADGAQTSGPFGVGWPTEVAAFRKLRIADRIAEANPYASSAWWASHGVEPADRMSVERWNEQVAHPVDRAQSHGVRVALGWLLGEPDLHDAVLMAPIHFEDGRLIDEGDRELYANRLRELVMPTVTPAVPRTAMTS